jgi:hypothetical protein
MLGRVRTPLHPRTESSGVVWGGPAPPALIVAPFARVERRGCAGVSRLLGVEGLAGGRPSRSKLAVRAVVPVRRYRSTTAIGFDAASGAQGARTNSPWPEVLRLGG